jgi:hypothetical protein
LAAFSGAQGWDEAKVWNALYQYKSQYEAGVGQKWSSTSVIEKLSIL